MKLFEYTKWNHYVGRIIDKLILPLTPSSYQLAMHYWKHTNILNWEPEVRKIRKYARKSDRAVDIGSNIGLWSYSMVKSKLFKEVLAIEPNTKLTTHLQNARLESITIIHKAVSSHSGVSKLKIPKQGELVLSGWASLETHIDLNNYEFYEVEVETISLDDMALENVGFVKIDIEGHELKLLSGARRFFLNNRPVCIIECRDRNKLKVKEYFYGLNVGYKKIDTKKKYGFKLSGDNDLYSVI